MSKSDRPRKFDRWSSVWSFWDDWLDEQGLTAIQACLSFAMADQNICKVIVGVDDLTQLKELLSSVGTVTNNFPENLERSSVSYRAGTAGTVIGRTHKVLVDPGDFLALIAQDL